MDGLGGLSVQALQGVREAFLDRTFNFRSSPIHDRYLKRIHEVMKDNYRLSDKFIVIAVDLCPADVDADLLIFERAKRLRDDITHGDAVDEAGPPVEDLRTLLRKLFHSHLNPSSGREPHSQERTVSERDRPQASPEALL